MTRTRRGRAGCALAAILALGLTGCDAPSEPRVERAGARDFPQGLYTIARDAGIAEAVARRCGDLAFSRQTYDRAIGTLASDLVRAGYREADVRVFARQVPQERLRRDTLAWAESRGVRPGDLPSLCRAGRTEIRAGSRIGSFLRERG